MKGIDEKLVRRVASRAEDAWRRGEWFSFWGFTWSASNPVDDWFTVWVIPKGANRRDQRAVAVYQRGTDGEIRNLEVLA